MNKQFVLLFLSLFFLISCKKEEQSCSDGIFQPDYEEEMDCGGVCPPCNFVPTLIPSFLFAKINNKEVHFETFGVTKNQTYNLFFSNDSIQVVINFGEEDILGGREAEVLGSNAFYKNLPYSTLVEGSAVFSELDTNEKFITGYFRAKFLSDNQYDTLFIEDGEFKRAKWY